jgi:hypothetical protein
MSEAHAARDRLKALITATFAQREPAFDAEREEAQAIAAALPSTPAIPHEQTTNNNTRVTYVDGDVIRPSPPSPLRSMSLGATAASP